MPSRMIKSFDEFVSENYLKNRIDPKSLGFDETKMKKNGYVEMTMIADDGDLIKGDKVLVSDTEIGQLDDNSVLTCYKDRKEYIVHKKNLEIGV